MYPCIYVSMHLCIHVHVSMHLYVSSYLAHTPLENIDMFAAKMNANCNFVASNNDAQKMHSFFDLNHSIRT